MVFIMGRLSVSGLLSISRRYAGDERALEHLEMIERGEAEGLAAPMGTASILGFLCGRGSGPIMLDVLAAQRVIPMEDAYPMMVLTLPGAAGQPAAYAPVPDDVDSATGVCRCGCGIGLPVPEQEMTAP